MQPKDRRGMKQKRSWSKRLQAVLLAVSIFCLGAFCYEMLWMPYQNQRQAKQLREDFPVEDGDTADRGESAGKESEVQLVDLAALRAKYPDVRGWLAIPGTSVDYPVLQSSEDNPEYYLKRNYKGERDANGSLFLQWNCSIEEGLKQIIYGHNMNSGAMFGNLDQYTDPAYWEGHRKVFFQTEKGMEEYQVAAVLKTDIRQFPFTKADVSEPDELREYVELAKTQALFETEADAAECRAALTLVTCAYEWDGARTVVIAVR